MRLHPIMLLLLLASMSSISFAARSLRPLNKASYLNYAYKADVYDFVKRGKAGLPGLVAVITPKGFQQLSLSANSVFRAIVPFFTIPPQPDMDMGPFPGEILDGKVEKFGKDGNVHIQPAEPNGLAVEMENLNIHLSTKIRGPKRDGVAKTELKNVNGEFVFSMQPDSNGLLRAEMTHCQARINLVHIHYDTNDKDIIVIRPFRIERAIKTQINQKQCSIIGKMISDMNEYIKKPFGEQFLLDPHSHGLVPISSMKRLFKLLPLRDQKRFYVLGRALVFKPSLTGPIQATASQTFSIPFLGKVCHRQRCNIPFHPTPLPQGVRDGNYMFSNTFPEQIPEIHMEFSKPPAVQFRSDGARFYGDFLMTLLAKVDESLPAKKALIVNCHFIMRIQLNAPRARDHVAGTVNFDQWNMQVQENYINADVKETSAFFDYTKQLIQTTLEHFFKRGFIISLPYLNITNLKLQMMDDALMAAFDFKIDEKRVVDAINATVSGHK
ncbi:Peptide-N4-(N-acetyl-beta-glucosaminyl)asparagine amidase [Trichinella pseudospiralis]